jgi:hypothetical protein
MVMADFVLPLNGLYNESEFNAGVGACGPTILAGAGRWTHSTQTPFASQMVTSMRAMGLCSPTGVTTMNNLRQAARTLHYPVQDRPAGVDPITFAIRCLQNLPGYRQGIVLLGIGNGQALTDYLSGVGEDAVNLHNHFIGLVGWHPAGDGYSNLLGCTAPEGFYVIDGANGLMNPVVSGRGRVHRFINTQLGYYTRAILSAALPFDAFAVTR